MIKNMKEDCTKDGGIIHTLERMGPWPKEENVKTMNLDVVLNSDKYVTEMCLTMSRQRMITILFLLSEYLI